MGKPKRKKPEKTAIDEGGYVYSTACFCAAKIKYNDLYFI